MLYLLYLSYVYVQKYLSLIQFAIENLFYCYFVSCGSVSNSESNEENDVFLLTFGLISVEDQSHLSSRPGNATLHWIF